MSRKLASIQVIAEKRPIEGADRIEAYRVNGWWIVDQKDRYEVGDQVVYCEIDSFIPHEIAPFLSKGREPREYGGVRGERLKTVKLRGQLSQGLLLPIDILEGQFKEGDDVTDRLGVIKWEPPISPQMRGLAKGNFPSFIPKTDQERIQNIKLDQLREGISFEVSLKLDGTSCTIYHRDGVVGVCSRNLELKLEESNSENLYVKTANETGLLEILPKIGNYAVQGEILGPGIQGNREKLDQVKFFVYDVFDIDRGEYLTPGDRAYFLSDIGGLDQCPILKVYYEVKSREIELEEADRTKSIGNPIAEGVVYKSMAHPRVSFKAISNKYLLKEK